MTDRLCLLQVHAHPDDEASKASATNALYAARGVRTVLVTCTGGEAGEVLNPALDTPETRANLPGIRLRELDHSARILGYAAVHLLGYRDSGMPGTPENEHAEAFANAELENVVGRLATIVRAERPHVIIAYGDDHSFYPHPDHIRAHEIAVLAFDAAGDPARYPDAGPPWTPLKLYYCGWTMRQARALDAAFRARGVDGPFAEWIERREDLDDRFGTRIGVAEFVGHRRRALAAHATQVAPDSFWMALSEEELRAAWPYEEFVLARSRVPAGQPDGGFETDLFSGIAEVVADAGAGS